MKSPLKNTTHTPLETPKLPKKYKSLKKPWSQEHIHQPLLIAVSTTSDINREVLKKKAAEERKRLAEITRCSSSQYTSTWEDNPMKFQCMKLCKTLKIKQMISEIKVPTTGDFKGLWKEAGCIMAQNKVEMSRRKFKAILYKKRREQLKYMKKEENEKK